MELKKARYELHWKLKQTVDIKIAGMYVKIYNDPYSVFGSYFT
jgi:predicted component of type VI protein secretion system